jgi:TonB family protein
MSKPGSRRATLLNIQLIEEKYGRSFLVSVAIHGMVILLFLFGRFLFPTPEVQIGTGAGGGMSGESYSVGVADEPSGGAGMSKPSLVSQPPVLKEKKPSKKETKAIPLPGTLVPKRERSSVQQSQKAKKESNLIPTPAEPGVGGAGGSVGGSGGGRGGGHGVSIGAGSGGFGDSWYARVVESRISSNWIRPETQERVEMVYSFYILADGSIRDIRREQSSGNPEMDRTAERAIRASSSPPLPPPPPEFRGKPIKFIAQFVYPPNQ